MSNQTPGRVDPRALIASVRQTERMAGAADAAGGLARVGVIALGAIVGLASFGTLVVRANDDAGALAFIRSQAKPRAVAVQSQYAAPRAAYPASYYAPRALFPTSRPSAIPTALPASREVEQRRPPIVASYAPFVGFLPGLDQGLRPPTEVRPAARPAVRRSTTADAERATSWRGGAVAYCVRTCDGFFFPLSNQTGSEKGDEAACNRLCPTSETRVYVGSAGADIDAARSRQTGRSYAQLRTAFTYRRSFDQACSCNAGGIGLTNEADVSRDRTLRAGDIVMTDKGMRVFTGGQMPYREANFTTVDRSQRFAGASRENLRRMEQASLPGRSGVAPRTAQRNRDELRDLRLAAERLPTGQMVRYVGPDRNAVAR